jgi:hypothetical protein
MMRGEYQIVGGDGEWFPIKSVRHLPLNAKNFRYVEEDNTGIRKVHHIDVGNMSSKEAEKKIAAITGKPINKKVPVLEFIMWFFAFFKF